MKKEQRLTTLTLLKLLKVSNDKTEESSLWRGKLLDGFTAAICVTNHLQMDDLASYRICQMLAKYTAGQYKTLECLKFIEQELRAYGECPERRGGVRG